MFLCINVPMDIRRQKSPGGEMGADRQATSAILRMGKSVPHGLVRRMNHVIVKIQNN